MLNIKYEVANEIRPEKYIGKRQKKTSAYVIEIKEII